MCWSKIGFVVLAILVTVGSGTVSNASTLDRWDVVVGLLQFDPDGQIGTSFTGSDHHFHDSHSASLGQSTAQASYDFDWWDNNGTFHIQTSHQAHDTGGTYHLEVISDGWIKFTPTEDLAFSIDAAYTYYLPAYAMVATFGFDLRDAQTGQLFLGYGDSDNSVFGAPVSGTFVAQGSGVLPAGRQYRFHYAMYLDTAYGASNTFATGNGYVNFQLTPEPTTLSLLVLSSLLLRRRHA